MPPVSTHSIVLVTGANGYIAVWIVKSFLERGYVVRGTVRSASKGEYLKNLFSNFGDKLEIVVVEDITKEGAFDEAVKGVDLVEHTASPFHLKAKEPDELIVPALKGTLSILESVRKFGTDVKRVVVTSSVAAVLRSISEPTNFSELDWNEPVLQTVKEKGASTTPIDMYRASKTLAEKAAWEFVKTHKDSITWDLVTLNPPVVLGPAIHEVTDASSYNTSLQDFYDSVVSGKRDKNGLLLGGAYVDVRDLADAHVLAGEKEEAGGERILIVAKSFFWQELLDLANALIPAPIANLPKGVPRAAVGKPYLYTYDATKSERILGLKYRSQEETVRDSLEDYKAHGFAA